MKFHTGGMHLLPSSVSSPFSLRQLWSRVRPVPLWPTALRVGCAVLLLLLESGTAVATPWLFSRLVGQLSLHDILFAALLALLADYACVSLLSGVAGPVRDMVIAPFKSSLKRQVALLGLEHLQCLDTRFHLNRQTGALTRVLDRGSEAVGTLLDLVLSNVLPNLISLVLTFSVILHVFRGLYLELLLGTVVLYGGISFLFTRLRMQARRARNRASNETNHHLVDTILNIETVRAFGNETYEARRHDAVRRLYQNAEVRLQLLISMSQAVRNSLIALSTVVLLGLAAWDIMHGRLGVAQFVLIGTYLRSVYASVGVLNYVGAGWRNARVDMENYLELLTLEPEITSPTSPIAIPVVRAQEGGADVRFSHVSFGYTAGRPVLHDISFHVPNGGSLAIVGRTGSGKSTLVRLLSRMYDPLSGTVQIDGHDVRNMTTENVRSLIGVVPQDCPLFNTTIGENIAYGRVSATQDEVRQAARRAHIHDFIESLPEGYDTVVGERGLKLSGGEKQRVAIARVILRDPRILVLDEASSALDTRTEAAIQADLRALARERTTLIVAHRLSTIRQADHILVLDKGRIMEEGTHEALLQRRGLYAALWQAQSGRAKPVREGHDRPDTGGV